MNVLDLFSGAAGGWSLGLHRAGMRTVAASEVDAWRREEFRRRWPEARMYGDVRNLTARRLSDDGVAPIDIVAGSPPCQDASQANHAGKGVDGDRTGLFWEAIRLIEELGPRWVVLENVPGLRTRGYDRVHDALERAGYAVRPLVVGAWHAGAPHRRNRVWIVANAQAVQRASIAWRQPNRDYALVAPNGDRGCRAPGAEDWQEAQARGEIFARLGAWPNWNGGPFHIGRMDDGLPEGLAEKLFAAFGDAVLPILTELIGRAIMQAEGLAP